MYYRYEDVSYHVEVQGKGTPLLLLHGFTGSSQTWSTFTKSWARYYQVITIDIIGHGKTDSPSDVAPYKMTQMMNVIVSLLDRLRIEKAFVLGYSMGARLALAFSIHYPERVKALILESGSPGLKTQPERMARQAADEELAAFIREQGVLKFVDYWESIPMFKTQKRMPEKDQALVRQERLAQCKLGLANSLIGMGTGAQQSYWEKLHTLLLPVLLITGELDQKFCEIAKDMSNQLKFCRYKVVLNTGHAIHVEQPRIFGKIVSEFLSQHEEEER
ncbi:2-succinyl-6-hydroxy-2,4-cyclohexadiene-1-carboxylate synthase [Priestia flexa]|jgi:2-succinyl-6-hydroxy-2,4-cyclohexadiene-1-carboxylate synthase|uniref:2-succinyl-6-hydroxy-2, 4-cyclohexadiene-1-carboxylate synthase n=1 Tax=Priestia flexa TaxID=86664 RepID=UPI00099C5A1B|nr:2-succinyl-6-hydroxy-2,4-cyclohexadiene-1-carboxylate synthase [Priestia flexa]AQX53405.1 2-succinyl-6-hydroxy-2,4-cyclohexadiene-1-carboxylate synthase [Priestia flexa]RIV09689.1 2-succinyl-6-hydroxy-2,4-cyclohexadiene-1-carboxylate synthase [Priestia flexa]